MARVLINLVGGQTQPNILLAKEIHHHIGQLDQLVLVHTKGTLEQSERTKKACDDLGAKVIEIEVIEDDIIDIQSKLIQKVTIEDDDEIYVNITGGTKIMSIAVYDHFEKYSAKILYVALGKNTYNQILPRVKNKETKFQYALNLEEYFSGYGVSIDNPKVLHKLTKSAEITRNFFQAAQAFSTEDWESLDLIRQGYQGRSYRARSLDRFQPEMDNAEKYIREKIFDFLDKIGFKPEEPNKLSKAETKYLTGDWFEEYVYSQLRTVLVLRDDHWGMGLQIKMSKDGNEVSNELDLAIMLKNDLHLIECKTRVITSDKSNILTDTLYKTDSLRSKFGLSVKSYLFTLADEEELKKGIPRGKLYDITIVARDVIQDQNKLKQLFKV